MNAILQSFFEAAQTPRQKRDYLNRASQRARGATARGATKNCKIAPHINVENTKKH